MPLYSPVTYRRWQRFKTNRRGYISLLVFSLFFVICLFAEVISNDKPFLISYQGQFFVPIIKSYPETAFGGDFATEADYRDPFIRQKITF
jgi:microcin C transport system permease protein